MKKYEIKSKSTGKVIYEGSADDPARDWNFKKKMLAMGRSSDRNLKKYMEKYGFEDLVFNLPEPEPKAKPKPKAKAKPIVKPEPVKPEPKKTDWWKKDDKKTTKK